jgi:hypothetical protein
VEGRIFPACASILPVRNVLVVTLSTGLLATACGHHQAVSKSGWRDVRDRAVGFLLRVPPDWHVYRHGPWCMRGGPGVIVSNTRRSWRRQTITDGCTTSWRLGHLPPGFRAIEVASFSGPLSNGESTAVPVSLARAYVGDHREAISVLRHGHGWGVIAYFGSAVSPRDRTLETIVRTIRFTR